MEVGMGPAKLLFGKLMPVTRFPDVVMPFQSVTGCGVNQFRLFVQELPFVLLYKSTRARESCTFIWDQPFIEGKRMDIKRVNQKVFIQSKPFLRFVAQRFYSGWDQQYIIYFDILPALLTVPMQLTVSAKQIGRKHPLITSKVIEIEDIGPNPTVQRLIEAVVAQQVQEYNNKPLEGNLLPFLDQEAIDEAGKSGKIGFGSIYNESKADPDQAQKTALQAFADGLFALFADDQEYIQVEQTIPIHSTTLITFIRLTFLAGSYW